VNAAREVFEDMQALNNVCFVELLCGFRLYMQLGTLTWRKIQLVKPLCEARGKVVWWRSTAKSFALGVEFMDADEAFRAHMVEQVCYIEHNISIGCVLLKGAI
jgi:hypothetical protein